MEEIMLLASYAPSRSFISQNKWEFANDISFPVSAQLEVLIAVHFSFSFYLKPFTNIIIMGLDRWLSG